MKMDNTTRQVVINKLGTLMMANAELAATNAVLAKQVSDHEQHIGMLKAELARWQQNAQRLDADVDRPEGSLENLPANPYNGALQ